MPNTTDKILKAINKNSLIAVRRAIYGLDTYRTHEAEAMRRFIESRQDWCKDEIIKNLETMGE